MKCNLAPFILLLCTCCAADGLAGLAESAIVPIHIAIHLLSLTFMIVGLVFLITSFSYWKAHRIAPVFMPMHKIITSMLLGIICLVIGYVNKPTLSHHVKPNPAAIHAATKDIPSPFRNKRI